MNYRYLADEIVYVLDNADAEVLVVHGAMADRVAAAAARLPKLRLQYLVLAHAVGRHGESEKVLGKALVPYEVSSRSGNDVCDMVWLTRRRRSPIARSRSRVWGRADSINADLSGHVAARWATV